MVLFANANYSHAFARNFSDVTLLEGENRVDAILRKRESFNLQFGLTSLLASGFYIEPTVSFNLNGVGNDVVLGRSMPDTFSPGL